MVAILGILTSGTSLFMAGGQVSNLWSCTTLGDGLDMMDADLARLQNEEAQLLAELQDPIKVVQISWLCWYLWSGSITVSKIKVVLMNLVVAMLEKKGSVDIFSYPWCYGFISGFCLNGIICIS